MSAHRNDPQKYEMNVYWSPEDAVFVAEVPELPGCMAHGPTPSAAVRNAEDAIELWIDTARADGVQVPEARRRVVR
jgi:predicted RNase H-like HicB family nuclease